MEKENSLKCSQEPTIFFHSLYEINPVFTFSHIIYLRCILILFSHIHLSPSMCVDLVRYSSRST